jgi:hypothetical protein
LAPKLLNGTLQSQNQCTGDGCGGLVYLNQGTAPWNKYYKVSCVSSDGIESDFSPIFGPVVYDKYNNPKIRIQSNGVNACDGNNTIKVYRGDTSTTMSVITPKNFANNGPYDGKDSIFTDS